MSANAGHDARQARAAGRDPDGTAPAQLPIAEHGLIGDLRSAALVGTDGTIGWYCPARFDAPSVFASLLDAEKGGSWRVAPAADVDVSAAHQFHFPDTNVLITRFLTEEGVVEVQDLMPVCPGPDEPWEPQRLLRRVLAVRGSMRMTCRAAPRFDYGRGTHETSALEDCGDARAGVLFADGDVSLALWASEELTIDGGDARATFELAQGESATFVLETLEDGREPGGGPSREEAEALFNGTVRFWRTWLEQSTYRGRWREKVQRSALTLKLLTYRPTGAIVAAPTAGLPEEIGGERNWDYRFVWLRDAAFSVYALLKLGFTDEARDFMGWLLHRFDDAPGDPDDPNGPLRPMYDLDGGTDLEEHALEHLAGYRGSTPVRIGNGAAGQLQLDIYGELIDSVYLYDKYATPIDHDAWTDLARTADWLCDHWDQRDESIWEPRGGPQEHTYSRLMCWVALERMIRMARKRGRPADLERWMRARDAIYHQTLEKGWSEERGAFVQHYDDDVLDASLLLMPMVKMVAPTEPRFVRTLEAIEEHLVSDSLVHRYDPEAAPDGLRGGEGTFSMCSFWYVEALTRVGRLDDARLALEKMFTYANHLGLYAEEISVAGEQLGNFPQAFTHLALISAATNLDAELG